MTPATADEVAELYGVGRTTVYRWVADGAFEDKIITRMKSPSGERDRVLFDRAATGKQFRMEMLEGPAMLSDSARDARTKAMKAFLDG